jgi:hypothetical protein
MPSNYPAQNFGCQYTLQVPMKQARKSMQGMIHNSGILPPFCLIISKTVKTLQTNVPSIR